MFGRTTLRTQIRQLQAEIVAATKRHRAANPNSANATQEAQLLARLRAEQADVSLQLDKVLDRIATGTPGASGSGGTAVIQHATEATGPSDASAGDWYGHPLAPCSAQSLRPSSCSWRRGETRASGFATRLRTQSVARCSRRSGAVPSVR